MYRERDILGYYFLNILLFQNLLKWNIHHKTISNLSAQWMWVSGSYVYGLCVFIVIPAHVNTPHTRGSVEQHVAC